MKSNMVQKPKLDASLLAKHHRGSILNSPTFAEQSDIAVSTNKDNEIYTVMKLSPELDEKINKNMVSTDSLDISNFDTLVYFNSIFSSQERLEDINTVLLNLQRKLTDLDQSCVRLVRNQMTSNVNSQEVVRNLKRDIEILINRIRAIKAKSSGSESLINEMTNDIRTLDETKRNLTATISLLTRIHYVSHTLVQVIELASNKNYVGVAELLKFILLLQTPLHEYKEVLQIVKLCDSVRSFQTSTKNTIIASFKEAYSAGVLKHLALKLCESCRVLEIMEIEAQSELVGWYCDVHIQDYHSFFAKTPEIAGLADIAHRYQWLKRFLKNYDEQHSEVFPVSWRVAECMTIRFCKDTRADIAAVLAKLEKMDCFETKHMVAAFELTLDFETKLDQRFNDSAPSDPMPASIFQKIIGTCFEPYLWHYVDMEDSLLATKFAGYPSDSRVNEDEMVLVSSTDLFLFYRLTLMNCAKLSKKKTFLDLVKMYQKWLDTYMHILVEKFPKDERRPTQEDVRNTCLIINTSEYCLNTAMGLEEKVLEIIDKDLRSLVSFQPERDTFLTTSATGISLLVRLVENTNDAHFLAMTRRHWQTLASVGDQSDHVTQIAYGLTPSILLIRQVLGSGKFFKLFCDKFTEYCCLLTLDRSFRSFWRLFTSANP